MGCQIGHAQGRSARRARHVDRGIRGYASPDGPPDPIEAIKFRMEQEGLTRKDLEPMIGTRTQVAEVSNRKRSLSIDMIRRLHQKLGISAEVLIRPSRRDRAA